MDGRRHALGDRNRAGLPHPARRGVGRRAPRLAASAVGVYRLWRDSGYAIGAIAAGLLADAFTMPFAITAIAALTFVSGVVVAGVMYETLPHESGSRGSHFSIRS